MCMYVCIYQYFLMAEKCVCLCDAVEWSYIQLNTPKFIMADMFFFTENNVPEASLHG